MSNHTYVEQITEVTHRNGDESQTVHIYDDYGFQSVPLYELTDGDYYKDPLDLLTHLLEHLKDGAIDGIADLLSGMGAGNRSMCVEGVWYSWEMLENLFKKHYD